MKKIVHVEKGINFLREIEGYELPNGILNKGITGCGATTLALEDKYPTIICCPRNQLLENKKEQYPNAFLLIQGVYEDEILDYLNVAETPKILVSYDSFYKLLECIRNKPEWRVVVDEFQHILLDASFKSEVILRLLDNLTKFPYVTHLSATPMLDKIIEEIDILKDVPYYELKWEGKSKPEVFRIKSSNPIAYAIDIVEMYKREDYLTAELNNGDTIQSKECVIFLNSVTSIVKIIKHCSLNPDDVNIIVGSSADNDMLIAELGEGFKKGRIPLKGEAHKKFTFCTSTAYAGCDFYSECASTFIISDCRRINTTIDVTIDLMQIAGRQRLESNPFRNHVYFIYNTQKSKMDEKTFLHKLEYKSHITKLEIESNNNADDDLKKERIADIKMKHNIFNYEKSYTMYDEESQKFVFNRLAYISEKYSYYLQNTNYNDSIMVKELLNESGFKVETNQVWAIPNEQLKITLKKGAFEENMKKYCEHKKGNSRLDIIVINSLERKNQNLKAYFNELGAEKIQSLNYKEVNLKRELSNRIYLEEIALLLTENIKAEFYSSETLKSILDKTYKKAGSTKRAKATDILKYCDVKETSRRVNGIKVRGYEVLKHKID